MIRSSDQVPRWKRILGVRLRWLKQRRLAILTGIAIPLMVLFVAGGLFYRHYANEIDGRLRGGLFRDSVDIYASPVVLHDGDTLTAHEFGSELQLAGYEEEPAASAREGTFQTSGNRAAIWVKGGPHASIEFGREFGGGRRIQRILIDGKDAGTCTLGYPLLANLSAGRERRRLADFAEIPPVLVDAVVSAEDKHFFQHSGLDLPRVMKAAWVDFRDGRKEQGASTLTMQLVRGLWLQPEKRWKRKLTEAAMTIHLERRWTKEKIFETYANQVYLGRQNAYSIHGFAEASQVFFGKELRDLTLPEAALLAGMVQRPSYFNPLRNPVHAKERRDLVLALMRENGYITRGQYQEAAAAPLGVANRQQHDDSNSSDYFLDLVADELQSGDGDDANTAARSVHTTIDLNLQRAAADAIATGMRQVDSLVAKRTGSTVRPEAALIAIDPHTGEIKALIGGRDYAVSQLNRVLAVRPPGSVFKPFVYAAAMNTAIEGADQVFTPASTVTDDPETFWSGGKAYQPANFRHESFGTMTLRDALARSDNVAAVKVAQSVGFDAVVRMARAAGLNDGIKATPAVALGAYGVTPLEMAGAWTIFANSGVWVKPYLISGTRDTETRQVLDPRVAYLMVSMLEEVMRSGTGAGVRSRGFMLPAAGKTGTSHDGWFAGFTSQLLCVVWVGFDDYRELNVEGAKSALPIWTAFMKRAAQLAPYRNAREFSAPGGIGSARICPESGKLAGDFCPDSRDEVFVAGTEPKETCDMHGYRALTNPDGEAAPDVAAPAAPSPERFLMQR